MKRILGLVLVALLVLSMSMMVFADPQNGGDLPYGNPYTIKL